MNSTPFYKWFIRFFRLVLTNLVNCAIFVYVIGYIHGGDCINITELAKRIGVSSATISRVINDSGYVSKDTRKKVLDAIEKYDYVPSAIARTLSTSDSRSIGVIIPDIENEFFSSVISGISMIAEQNDYIIDFMGTNENAEIEYRFLEVVEKQRLDGVIITPVSEDDEITRRKLEKMMEHNIPIVVVDREVNGLSLPGVFVDNVMGAYDGVKALIEAGHERIAIIRGPESSKPGKNRYKGYLKALMEYDIDVHPEYIVTGDFKAEQAYRCMEQLMNLIEPPTAVFSSNNLTTIGCLKYLTEHKMKIGREISLIGFDDIEALKAIQFNLSVVARDAKEQGALAMKMMLDRLEQKEGGKSINVPYQLILRGSERVSNKENGISYVT